MQNQHYMYFLQTTAPMDNNKVYLLHLKRIEENSFLKINKFLNKLAFINLKNSRILNFLKVSRSEINPLKKT